MQIWFRGVAKENRDAKTSVHMIEWYEVKDELGDVINRLPETREEAEEAIEQLRFSNPGLYGALTGEVVELGGHWYAVTDGVFASTSPDVAARFGGDFIQVLTGELAGVGYDGDIVRNPKVLGEFAMTKEGLRQAIELAQRLEDEE